jgi:hypothetical protein
VLFSVETDGDGTSAIRFGLVAVKNVGEGAIEAIVAAREGRSEISDDTGPFASLEDLCRRVDLRTVNKRVAESLIKAGAMATLGTPGSLLARLDPALEAGARHQRDVAAGQGTLFDLFAAPELAAPIGLREDMVAGLAPADDEVPRRERLRWEKELLGLYLSEHPLGDIADQLPEFVTAYTGDLAEESDQAKVTLGGIILSSRRVITRAGSTMLVATIEDLQGSVEVVVFPKVFADTANAWADDTVVLVTGRVDHRDDSSQILCEAVHAWDDAVRMGPVAFGAERDRLLRARGGRGAAYGNGSGGASGAGRNGAAGAASVPADMPSVQPIRPRGTGVAPGPVPGAPAAGPVPVAVVGSEPPTEPPTAAIPVGPPEVDDAPAPADAVPLPAMAVGAGTIAIGFEEGVSLDLLLPAIESVTQAIRNRPGQLPVVVSIPVAGATRQVRLADRAEWDERLAEQVRQAAGVPVAVELRPTPADG